MWYQQHFQPLLALRMIVFGSFKEKAGADHAQSRTEDPEDWGLAPPHAINHSSLATSFNSPTGYHHQRRARDRRQKSGNSTLEEKKQKQQALLKHWEGIAVLPASNSETWQETSGSGHPSLCGAGVGAAPRNVNDLKCRARGPGLLPP